MTAFCVMSTIRAIRTSSPTPTIRPSTIASLRSGEYKIVPSAASNASGCSTASDLCRADDARAALREGGGAIAAAAAGAGSDLSGGVCSCLADALATGSCRVGGGAVRIAGNSARAAVGVGGVMMGEFFAMVADAGCGATTAGFGGVADGCDCGLDGLFAAALAGAVGAEGSIADGGAPCGLFAATCGGAAAGGLLGVAAVPRPRALAVADAGVVFAGRRVATAGAVD